MSRRLRVRRSTVILTVVFLATLVLYLEVRPPPPTPVPYLPVQPVPVTTAPKRATTTTAAAEVPARRLRRSSPR